MKVFRKVMYIAITILEVLVLAGAYAVNYFANKKMGMARYVIYKNQQWEGRYPVNTLTNILAAVLIAMAAVVILLLVIRRKRVGRMVYCMSGVMVLLTGWYTYFALTGSKDLLRAYYFLSVLFASAAFIQICKTLAGVLVCKNEE